MLTTSNWSGLTIVVYLNPESILGGFGDRRSSLVIMIEVMCNESRGICCHCNVCKLASEYKICFDIVFQERSMG